MIKSLTLDNLGNVYILGTYTGNVDFDLGPDTMYLNAGYYRFDFFAKYDNSGNIIWVKTIKGALGNDIKTDSTGNIYITGSFGSIMYNDTADFNPGYGNAILVSQSSTDMFIAKYDENGSFIWVKGIGSNSDEIATKITIDNVGNIYLTGIFNGMCDFDPDTGNAYLTANTYCIFIAKYNNNGNYVWAINISSSPSYQQEVYSINLDDTGNVYIAGCFTGVADFDSGPGVANLTSVGGFDIYFAKYNPNGNYIWAKSISGEFCSGMALDNNGNIYITGHFGGNADFDPGPGNVILSSSGFSVFIAKYDNNGEYVFAKKFNTTNMSSGRDIAIDCLGNINISGFFTGTVDFDPGSGYSAYTSIGDYDIFFGRYNNNGDYLFAKSIGTLGEEYAYHLDVDVAGSIFIAGLFSNTLDFDPGTGTAYYTANGLRDMFLAKYGNTVNINESGLYKLTMYPNPAINLLSIEVEDIQSFTEGLINIYDMQGRLIKSVPTEKQHGIITIDVSGIKSGIYIVSIGNKVMSSYTAQLIIIH